jgi:hypothetical protein
MSEQGRQSERRVNHLSRQETVGPKRGRKPPRSPATDPAPLTSPTVPRFPTLAANRRVNPLRFLRARHGYAASRVVKNPRRSAKRHFLGVEVRIIVADQSSDRHEKARILTKGKSIRKNITICPKITISLRIRKVLRVRSTPFARVSEKTAARKTEFAKSNVCASEQGRTTPPNVF